jgi:hypothetical protein
VKGGFGQYNLCYPYERDGKLKPVSWMDAAISYVTNYAKGNLLTNPHAENETDSAASIAQEQAAGFQSNPRIRKAIEAFAMSKAQAFLKSKGYINLKNTAKFKPYDYTCERADKSFFVEVKGTQTSGKTLVLTNGEFRHANKYPESCLLVLVHSVRVSGKIKVKVSGGSIEVRAPWKLRSEDLTPIQYIWTVR